MADNGIINILIDEAEKGNPREVVLFLRVDAVETETGGVAERFSLHLDVSADIPLSGRPTVPPVAIEIGGDFHGKLHEFGQLRRNRAGIRDRCAHEAVIKWLEQEATMGTDIYRTFFPGAVGETLEAFSDLLVKRKIRRLTLVIGSSVPWILDIPFEMMRKEGEVLPVSLFHNGFHLAHTVEKTSKEFRVTGMEPLAPPLKMLYVSALPVDLPEEERLLELEREQELLIEALGDLTSEKVLVEFLDIATLEEVEKALSEGGHHVVHFSGHGGHFDQSDQKRGVLYLEDEWGRVKEVRGEELARVLSKYGSVQLVVLSACETAHAEDYGVAGALINGGIPAVLGMRYPVSDAVASLFTSGFYKDVCTGVSLNGAMFNARQTIHEYVEKLRKAQQKETEPQMIVSEWMTPVLYLNQNTCKLMNYSKPPTDTRYFFQKPVSLVQGGKYVGRGFIGRHKEILSLYRLFREGNRGVCIYGQGGTGKTTLAIRFADNFENGAYKIVQFRDEVSEETILTRLAKEAAPLLGEQIVQMVESPELEPLDKLNVLIEHFLSRKKIILLFDNFEENQRTEIEDKEEKLYQREIYSPRLTDFLAHLCNRLTTSSYVLFTTRYLFPEPVTAPLNLGEMRWSDSFKLINRFEKLVHMPYNEKKQVHGKLGGHPRGLELLESYMSHEKVEWPIIDKKLKQVEDWEINHDLLLDMLWYRLTENQRTALIAASVFRGLTAPEGLMAVTGQTREKVTESIETLNALSLLYLEEEKFYAHRLTATFVQKDKMEKKQIKEFHHMAADYFTEIECEKGAHTLNDLMESRWHYLEAKRWDRAVGMTFVLDRYLTLYGYPQLSFELLTELGEKPLNDKSRSGIYHQIGTLCQHFGAYDEALTHHQKSMEIYENLNDINGVSVNLLQIGNIYYLRCNYTEALIWYQRAKTNFEKISDIGGISSCLLGLGNINLSQGKYDEALKHYEEVRAIKEKIGDIMDVSDCLAQIGIIYQKKADYENALKNFQKVLDISEKRRDIKGTSASLLSIGNIYYAKGDYDKALEKYEMGKEISEKIGDVRNVSNCLHQIGMAYQGKKDNGAALTYYQKSLEINNKINNIVGIALTYSQIGKIYFSLEDYQAALNYFVQALFIFVKTGSPQTYMAKRCILAVREKMPEEEFAAILKEFGPMPEMFQRPEDEG